MNLSAFTKIFEKISDVWLETEFEYETLFCNLIVRYKVVKAPQKIPKFILQIKKSSNTVYVYDPDQRSYTERRIGKPALGPSPPFIFSSISLPATKAKNKK